MTIAAGLAYADGIILGADTELTGGASVEYDSKMGRYAHRKTEVWTAYAGHSDFAQAALEKLERRFQSDSKTDTERLIEQTLEAEYRRQVHQHPDRRDGQYDYQFLVVIRRPGQPAKLFVTQDTMMREIKTYRCIGVGQTFGHHFLRPRAHRLQPFAARVLIASLLGAAKDHVPDCGGQSHLIDIKHNSVDAVEYLNDPFFNIIVDFDRVYRSRAWILQLAIMNPETTPELLEDAVNKFVNYVTLTEHPSTNAATT